jgi:CO/xanthine dehydrogenase FAD-binding subunit
MYARFDLVTPHDLGELLAAYAQEEQPPMLLAGGTVALLDIRSGKADPKIVLSLDRVADLRRIRREGKAIVIGARTTVSDILASADLAAAAPSLGQASELFAGQMVRNAATVAGNIACGSPAADLVPPLMSLDAEVELTGAATSRRVALADYYRGYKQDVREAGELITGVILPDLEPGDFNAFYKLARRRGDAITVVGVAATLHRSGGRCSKVRIALGSVAPAPMRATAAEAILEGRALSDSLIEAAAEAAERACSPIDDVRASAGYRRKMVRVLVRRLLDRAANVGQGR